MSSVLPSGWLRMLSSTALTPSAVTMLKTGSSPRSTRATSRTRIGHAAAPMATTMPPMSSAVRARASTTVRYSVWFSSCMPVGAIRLLRASASLT